MELDLALEYLSSRETVTNTRLACITTLRDLVVQGGGLDTGRLSGCLTAALATLTLGSNIRVRSQALLLVADIARAPSLGPDLGEQLGPALPLLLERMGDASAAQRMVAAAAATAFEAVLQCVGAAAVYAALLVAKAFTHKSFRVREQLLRTLAAAFEQRGARELAVQLPELLEHTLALLGDRSAPVRGAAADVLVALYPHVGDGLRSELQRAPRVRDVQLRQLLQRLAAGPQPGAPEGLVALHAPQPAPAPPPIRPKRPAATPHVGGAAGGARRAARTVVAPPIVGAGVGASAEAGAASEAGPEVEVVPAVTVHSGAELRHELKAAEDALCSGHWMDRVEGARRLR
jgi:hypothetical protein